MKSPAAVLWLDAWERGMSVLPVWRPVVLLDTLHGASSGSGGWSLGRREAALLELRQVLFGDEMESLAACPECGELLEFTLQVGELLAAAPANDETSAVLSVVASGISGAFRLPTTEDLAAAAAVTQDGRRHWLLSRCAIDLTAPDGGWPGEFVAVASAKMATADPLGDVNLSLSCSACGTPWSAVFDTGAFLWAELCAWATRLMSEIHLLAMSYGWTEGEIISLPPHRREYYLDRASQV